MPIEAFGELLEVPPSASPTRPRFDTLIDEQRLLSSPLPPPPEATPEAAPVAASAPPPPAPLTASAPPRPAPPTAPAPPPPAPDAEPLAEALEEQPVTMAALPEIAHAGDKVGRVGGDLGSAVDPFLSRAEGDPLAKTSESPVMALDDLAGRLADLAKHALLKGDLGMLERLVSELRLTGEHAELVERMTGFISLGRGAKSDALRRLRAAADAEQRPARRARALLAYGVALAAAGRTEGALLEVLTALARAREAEDHHGEQACARFLARLSFATGHEAAGRAWTEIARRAHTAAAD
jgi:type IV secretory pathway VirB10-like protein